MIKSLFNVFMFFPVWLYVFDLIIPVCIQATGNTGTYDITQSSKLNLLFSLMSYLKEYLCLYKNEEWNENMIFQ